MNIKETDACSADFFENYDYYWLKYTMDRGAAEHARYLLVGHSLARFGVNDRGIPGMINLAFLSQDYYYSSKIAEKAMESIPTLRHIVLGTTYYSPYMDLSRAKSAGELGRIVRVYGRFFGDIHNMDKEKYAELRSQLLPDTGSGFSEEQSLRLFRERQDDYFAPKRDRQFLSGGDWAEPHAEEERYQLVKARTDYHNKLIRHESSYAENSLVLKDMAALCHSKGVSLSLAVFPANRYYRSSLDPKLKAGYSAQIASIPAEYRPAELDLFSGEIFDSITDYADTDHLNDAGASKMTAILREYLENMSC